MLNMGNISDEYVAGLFDGEGCFVIYKASVGSKNRLRDYYLTGNAVIEIREELIVDLLKEKYDGSKLKKKARKVNHSDTYVWKVKGTKLKKFIEKVYPFLILKKQQAGVMLEFLKIRENKYSKKVTNEEIELQLILKDKMNSLNKKGK